MLKLQVVLVPPSALKRGKPRVKGPSPWGSMPPSPYPREMTSTPNNNSFNTSIVVEQQLRKFLHITSKTKSLLDIAQEISDRFAKLYPDEDPLTIVKLQDSQECDLDPDYTAQDVFDYDNVVRVILSREIKSLEDTVDAEIGLNANGKRPASQNNSILNIPKKRASSKRESIWNTSEGEVRKSTPLANQVFPDDDDLNTSNRSLRNISINNESDLSLPPPEDDTTRYLDPKKHKPSPASPLPSSKRITSGMLVAPEPQLKDAEERTLHEQEIQEKLTQKLIPSKKSPEDSPNFKRNNTPLKDILKKRDTSYRKSFFSDDSDNESDSEEIERAVTPPVEEKKIPDDTPLEDKIKKTPLKKSPSKPTPTPATIKKTQEPVTSSTQIEEKEKPTPKKTTAAAKKDEKKSQEKKAQEKKLAEEEKLKKAEEKKVAAEAEKAEQAKKTEEKKADQAKKLEDKKTAEVKKPEETKGETEKTDSKVLKKKTEESPEKPAVLASSQISKDEGESLDAEGDISMAGDGMEPYFTKKVLLTILENGRISPYLKKKFDQHSATKPAPKRMNRFSAFSMALTIFKLEFPGDEIPEDLMANLAKFRKESEESEKRAEKRKMAISETQKEVKELELKDQDGDVAMDDAAPATHENITTASSQVEKPAPKKTPRKMSKDIFIPASVTPDDIPDLDIYTKAVEDADPSSEEFKKAVDARRKYIFNAKRRADRRTDSAAKAADTPSKNATKAERQVNAKKVKAATKKETKEPEIKSSQAEPSNSVLKDLIVPLTEITKEDDAKDLFLKAKQELQTKKKLAEQHAVELKLVQKKIHDNSEKKALAQAPVVKKLQAVSVKTQAPLDSSDDDLDQYDSAVDTTPSTKKSEDTTSSSSGDGSSSEKSDSDSSESESESDSSDDESSTRKPRIVNTPKSFSQPTGSLNLRKAVVTKNAPEISQSQPTTVVSTPAKKDDKGTKRGKNSRLSLSSLSDLATRGVPDVQDSLTPRAERELKLSQKPVKRESDEEDSADDSGSSGSDSNSGSEDSDSDSSDEEQEISGSQKFLDAKAAKNLLKGAPKRAKRVSSAFKDLMKDASKAKK